MDDDTDWSLVDFDEPKKTGAVKAALVSKGQCPKCGKALKPRGQHLHIRACKGVSNEPA